MIRVKVNNNWYELPTTWKEITCNQFFKLKDSDLSLEQILSILLNMEVSEVEKIRQLDFDTKIYPFLTWVTEKLELDDYIKGDTITIEGKTISIPKDIKECTFGQKLAVQSIISKAPEDIFNNIIKIASVYLYPLYSGQEFDRDKSMEFSNQLYKCRMSEVYPIGAFFLNNLMKLSNLNMTRLEVVEHPSKCKRVFKKWINLKNLIR